ncbi:MAG: hypothetical protein J2P36_38425, partial [Ktedonobacteraceae bacterium]|nr:hypothetical protein [Ktedonobacteraceae bacterium]
MQNNYDVLKDTWIYQEIKQQIMEEMHEQCLSELRQAIFEIVEARFPRLLPLARKVAIPLRDSAEVRTLLVVVGSAKG